MAGIKATSNPILMLYFPLLYLYQILSMITMSTTLQLILTFLILGKRLHDFVVGVLDEKSDHFNLCGTYVGDAPRGKWTQISCVPNANGRNVLITIPGLSSDGDFLTLCEVEVFGKSKWSTYCTIVYFYYHDQMHALSWRLSVDALW